ncbi:alpha-amylase family glycosyl hydrolase [Fodinibius sp. AD559]|uniref:alpha-amylase family glycosyl hydrolase n=1 Tax=Fodinibius sp. AD559 TaxID=3424179 RepID=UPI004046DBE2
MNNFMNTKYSVNFFVLLALFALSSACSQQSKQQTNQSNAEASKFQHPEWAKNATIYEVNVRQYTSEGTFDSFKKHIPRLKKMGVEILWLMPIHPIGEKNRKGKLGSYYSIKDYKAVNSEFGTLRDLKELVKTAHENDMKVILDWVANHTAWDHIWTKKHPEWYTKDENGNFQPPIEDWSDVIELDFNNHEMRDAMINAMEFWVKEANIDGYRADYAMDVPTEFWNRAREELDQIKPVFMLAEAEQPDHHNKAFDMSYAWKFHELTNEIAHDSAGPKDIDQYMAWEDSTFPNHAYRMYFTSNHDENSWNGTAVERYGPALEAMAVLTSTIDGMPLVYNGQETRINKRLEFFQRDTIRWKGSELYEFYTKLLQLNQNNPALWNGKAGGDFVRVKTNNKNEIYAYKRIKNKNEVFVLLNLSDQKQTVTLKDFPSTTFTDIFSENSLKIGDDPIDMNPWGYRVLKK